MSKLTVQECEELLNNLKAEAKLPEKATVLDIVSEVKRILHEEPNLHYLESPCYLYGDIHGQFYDLLNMENDTDNNGTKVFLGDIVDRGRNSTETLLYLLLLKIINPKKIIILRGNHETRSQTAHYGFKIECVTKYDHFVYWKLCETFKYLPIAAIINNSYICLHGGIIPHLSVDQLKNVDRFDENHEAFDVLWSDPCKETTSFEDSARGCGYLFGKQQLDDFLKSNNLKYLIRSHQLVNDGYEEDFDQTCITIWSAPNYCYSYGNKAVVMSINGEGHSYKVYDAVEKQY